MKKVGYDGDFLTLEVTIENKPDRHTHDIYAGWSFEEFLKNAYIRADKINKILTTEV